MPALRLLVVLRPRYRYRGARTLCLVRSLTSLWVRALGFEATH